MKHRMTTSLTLTLTLSLLLLLTLCLAGSAEAADAQVVRGQVAKQLADGTRAPAPQVEVKLMHATKGVVGQTFTRSDGMYHLSDVPYGEYELQVEYQGATLKVKVVVDQEVEDVAPMVLR